MTSVPRASRNLGLFLSLSLSAFCARADLYSASVAYGKKDYAAAFKEFRELAELGQPTAQFNLAVMYINGQGTEVSRTSAHAWASLAQTNGDPHAAALVAKLEPELTPNSLRFSAEIQAQFGGSLGILGRHARLVPVSREVGDEHISKIV